MHETWNSARFGKLLHYSLHYYTINTRLTYTYTVRYIQQSGLVCHGEGNVKRRISGVSIGGVQWKVGYHCLYQDGAGGVTRFGSVTNMFHGIDTMMDEFTIFELQNEPITSCMGHYCLLSDNGHTTVFVMWDQVLWRCKKLLLGDHTNMGLPIKSCTSQELVQLR